MTRNLKTSSHSPVKKINKIQNPKSNSEETELSERRPGEKTVLFIHSPHKVFEISENLL